jgi:glycine/D-amino acid oxidase-like deaminating enzyme
MKTNDVTGRFTPGLAGVAIEMGRPGVATSFRDLELMAQAVAGAGVEFEPANPVTAIMADRKTGRLDPAVVGERALSAIIELVVPLERLGLVLEKVKATAPRLKTVFSLDVISLVHPDGSIPTRPILEAAGFTARPNAKTNVGLGRPLKPVRF